MIKPKVDLLSAIFNLIKSDNRICANRGQWMYTEKTQSGWI